MKRARSISKLRRGGEKCNFFCYLSKQCNFNNDEFYLYFVYSLKAVFKHIRVKFLQTISIKSLSYCQTQIFNKCEVIKCMYLLPRGP